MQNPKKSDQIIKLQNELEKQAVRLNKIREENFAKELEIRDLKQHIFNMVRNSCRNTTNSQASHSRQEYAGLLRDNQILQDQLNKLEQVNIRLMKNIERDGRVEKKSPGYLEKFLEKGVSSNSRAVQGGLPSLGKKR